MLALPGTDLVPAIVAAGHVAVIPVRADWLLHRCVVDASNVEREALEHAFGDLRLAADSELGTRSDVVADSWWETRGSGLVSSAGSGLQARWVVDQQVALSVRRRLLRLEPDVVAALAQAGKRLAAMSATVLKNADSAASSWTSTTDGDVVLPTVRQPLLVALR